MRDLANYVHIDDLPQQLWNANILALIGEVTTRALKACWFQK